MLSKTIIVVTTILALASSIQAAPRLYQFKARRDIEASDHHKEGDKVASATTVTVFTTLSEDSSSSVGSAPSTVTVVATNAAATATVSSASVPNTTGTILDLIASLGLNETSSATDLISALNKSSLVLFNSGNTGDQANTDVQGQLVEASTSGGCANGGNGGNANSGDADGGNGGNGGGFTHIVNGNEITGNSGDFNGTTVNASNPASS